MVVAAGGGGGGSSSPKPTTTYTGSQEHRYGSGGSGKKGSAGGATHKAKSTPTAPPPPEAATGSPHVAYDVPTGPLINPGHHPLSENQFLLGRENARRNPHRGTIVRTADRAGTTDAAARPKQRYAFRFLYNPETISFNTNVYTGVVPPEYTDPADETAGGAKFIGQESVSFGLMLDRTQEVYERQLNDWERNRGTLPDLEALYRVANGSIGMAAGFLYLSEVEIHWGPRNALPMFRGYITSINVTHTKFTPNMTPMRSLVDINVVRLSSPKYGQTAIQEAGTLAPETTLAAAGSGIGNGMPGAIGSKHSA